MCVLGLCLRAFVCMFEVMVVCNRAGSEDKDGSRGSGRHKKLDRSGFKSVARED